MPRRLGVVFLLVAGSAAAAIWPEQLGELKRTKLEPVSIADKPVWDEYGLEASEHAVYGGEKGFTATGYRLKDPTSAIAVIQWLGRPALRIGNYVLLFENGYTLPKNLQDLLTIQLPKLDQSAIPTLPDYLPPQGLVPGSQRYIVGPVSLEKFEPRIGPATAGFSMGAEGQTARYKAPAGELSLSIFSYPTPQIARERTAEFQKLPATVVKRSGPLVIVALGAPSADDAERLLAKINFQANIMWNERIPKKDGNIGDFLMGAVTLIGVLLVFTVVAGLAYAGVRIAWRKWTGRGEDESEMVTLHLE